MVFFYFLSFFLTSSFHRRPDALRQNYLRLLSQEEVMGTEHRSIRIMGTLSDQSLEDDALWLERGMPHHNRQTNDDRYEEDQIACAGFARHGQGRRGQDRRCRRRRRSSSTSSGRWARDRSRSIPQEAGGRYTSEDPSPSVPSATPSPKSRYSWNPAPSALAAPHAQYADIPPLPSAPPLELLMEEGFYGGPTDDDRPSSDAPPPRDERGPDRGHAGMRPLAEAAVVLMPVCEAVRTVGPTPLKTRRITTS